MDIVGIHSPKANAIQLVSNRHTALEKFVQIILQRAYKEKEKNNLILLALQTAKEISPYVDTIPRNVISKMAHDKAVELDAALKEYMPEKFVSDPEFELGTSAERQQIVEKIKMEKGQAAVDKLTIIVRDLLIPFATYGRGYVYTIMNKDAN
jgi:hypothetical protein